MAPINTMTKSLIPTTDIGNSTFYNPFLTHDTMKLLDYRKGMQCYEIECSEIPNRETVYFRSN